MPWPAPWQVAPVLLQVPFVTIKGHSFDTAASVLQEFRVTLHLPLKHCAEGIAEVSVQAAPLMLHVVPWGGQSVLAVAAKQPAPVALQVPASVGQSLGRLVQALPATEHVPGMVGHCESFRQMVWLVLHRPVFAQFGLMVVQAAPEPVHAPLTGGHCASTVQAAAVALQPPLAGGQPVLSKHAAPETVQAPACVGQLASLVHTVPVCTVQWPALGHCALLAHALPSRLQVPRRSGQSPGPEQILLAMLQRPEGPQAALLKQAAPVLLHAPASVGHTAAALAAVQTALVRLQLPTKVGGGQVVTTLHGPHSDVHRLQFGGSKAVVQVEGSGST